MVGGLCVCVCFNKGWGQLQKASYSYSRSTAPILKPALCLVTLPATHALKAAFSLHLGKKLCLHISVLSAEAR